MTQLQETQRQELMNRTKTVAGSGESDNLEGGGQRDTLKMKKKMDTSLL